MMQNKPQQIQKIEIISSMSSDHNGIKLETNLKGKNHKLSNTWIQKHVMKKIISQQWDKGRNQKVSGNKWKWIHNKPKPTGHIEDRPERKIYNNTLLQKTEKSQIHNLTLHLQKLDEQQQTKPRVSKGRK